MSLSGKIMKAAARKAKVRPGELKKISGKTQLQYLKEAMNHITADLNTKDKTLYNTIQKTITEGATELNQLHPQLKRWMSEPNSFGMFLTKTTPFIVYGGYVWSLGGGTLAADWKDCMEEYVAYKVGILRTGKGITSADYLRRKTMPTKNLTNVATKLTAIRAAN